MPNQCLSRQEWTRAVSAAEQSVRAGRTWSEQVPTDDVVSADDAADLLALLGEEQAELVLGLHQSSEATRNLVGLHLPRGTRELLASHEAIDEHGHLTALGVAVARQLAFAAHRGPDPVLVMAAEQIEAKLR